MKHPRTISIRCIIAIVLMALTIVFLFWPSFFSIKAKNTLSGASAGYSQSFLEYRNDITQMLQNAKQKQGKSPAWGFSVIALNAAFFALIALVAVSIVLMLLNCTKATLILHTILSFVTVVGVAIYWGIGAASVGGNGMSYSFIPGAAMFLLPLCSLAASILYKRERQETAAPTTAAKPDETQA